MAKKKSAGYSSYYAAQTGVVDAGGPVPGAPSEDFLAAMTGGAVVGASQIVFKKTKASGAATQFKIRPAAPVNPVSSDSGLGPQPGFFQQWKADGTIGTNWLKVGLVGVGGIAAVIVLGVAMRRRGR